MLCDRGDQAPGVEDARGVGGDLDAGTELWARCWRWWGMGRRGDGSRGKTGMGVGGKWERVGAEGTGRRAGTGAR